MTYNHKKWGFSQKIFRPLPVVFDRRFERWQTEKKPRLRLPARTQSPNIPIVFFSLEVLPSLYYFLFYSKTVLKP
jgi:hypothetical protein